MFRCDLFEVAVENRFQLQLVARMLKVQVNVADEARERETFGI